ncbi:MAG TPA: hypothetical protein VGW74_10470 [Propionibacteriaceae bacterium]|nr:hypothetical protein [Propionibacteriaceae bacterium]
MDEPTDPLARQLALSALTTEQFNLQTARMGTIAEANGRSTLYVGALSSTVIAIAFVGQASELGDAFYLFALALLPPVFLLGVFSYLRLVQLLLTAASMVGCINAIVGGVTVALALRSLLEAPVPAAAATGALVALALAALCFGYQVRRFGRAAAVVPELYEDESPSMPGWTNHVQR